MNAVIEDVTGGRDREFNAVVASVSTRPCSCAHTSPLSAPRRIVSVSLLRDALHLNDGQVLAAVDVADLQLEPCSAAAVDPHPLPNCSGFEMPLVWRPNGGACSTELAGAAVVVEKSSGAV